MCMVAVEVQSCETWVSRRVPRRVLPAREPTPKSSANISDSRPFLRAITRGGRSISRPQMLVLPTMPMQPIYLSLVLVGENLVIPLGAPNVYAHHSVYKRKDDVYKQHSVILPCLYSRAGVVQHCSMYILHALVCETAMHDR